MLHSEISSRTIWPGGQHLKHKTLGSKPQAGMTQLDPSTAKPCSTWVPSH